MQRTIRQESNRYTIQGICLSILLAGACNILLLTGWNEAYQWPTLVSCVFSIVTTAGIGRLWRWVAQSHSDMLTTFYSSVSGFRLLAALLVLTGCYIAVGRDGMAPYVVIFAVFYFVELIHHAVFFSRISHNN